MTETKVKTQSVTNTQIAVAVVAAFLAGGLAFAASPHRQKVPACTVQNVEWVDSSCKRKGQYHTASYVCSDGSSGRVAGKACRTTKKLQKAAERACSRKQCVVGEEPGVQELPVIIVPPEEDNSTSGSGNVQEPAPPEEVQCNGIRVGIGGCIPFEEPQNNEQPGGQIIGKPIVYISGKEILFQYESGRPGGKVVVGVPLANRGRVPAGSDVHYTLYFLDQDRLVVQMLDLNLSSTLRALSEKTFETVLPIPEGARYAQVVIDPGLADGEPNDVITEIPPEFLSQ